MSRKDTLRAMLSGRKAELPPGNTNPDPPAPPQHLRAGPVGAMSRSLEQMAAAADRARALAASGVAVVELEAERIEPSFIVDRMAADPDADADLRRAIVEAGQRSPVLVRPHPDKVGRYQTVFGHRRVRVLGELGRPVRAIVQDLTDEELVVVQGQENAARADLTYIERALFALTLEKRGFDRSVMMSALGMEKTQLSRLLSLAHALPIDLVEAIGPAPKAGRPRWAELAERLAALPDRRSVDSAVAAPDFRAISSDARFAAVFGAAAAPARAPDRRVIRDDQGQPLATIARGAQRTVLTIEETRVPDFGAFVAAALPELHARFVARSALHAPQGADRKD